MPPLLTFLAGLGLIQWFINKDKTIRTLPSRASWIPIIWLSILGSRSLTQWLGAVGYQIEGSVHGNVIDAAFYAIMIACSLSTLVRRNFKWGAFCSENKLLILAYLYLAVTSLWADDGVATFKRAVKDFGSVLVALVMLTESNPFEVIRTIYVRVSYYILILSVVFIKWFPDIGRRPDRGGSSLFCGVSTHKSTLGMIVFVFSMFIAIDLYLLKKESGGRLPRVHFWIRYVLLAVAYWLLDICKSTTALICLILGLALFFASSKLIKLGSAKKIILGSAFILLIGLSLENTFHLSTEMMIAVGKDPTMTGRTEIWNSVEKGKIYPVLGYGYYSYWESPTGHAISETFMGTLKTIHNGYLEMFIDCGAVGLALLLVLLVAWCFRAVERSLTGTAMGRLALVFWCLAIIYNFSETSYFRLEPMWFTLLLLLLAVPRPERGPELAVR